MLISILKDLAGGNSKRSSDTARAAPEPAKSALTYGRGGTIVAFVGGSRGDALRQHTLEMLKPLRPHCADVAMIDLRDSGWRAAFDAAACGPIWFAMSPFGGGEFLPSEGGAVNPWTPAGIPFVRLYGDVPAYYPAKHLQHFPNSINAYGHAEHRDFFLRWFEPKAPVLFQPLFPLDSVPREAVDLAAKSAGARILFPKNGNSPDHLTASWRQSLPPTLAGAIEAVAEEARSVLDEPFDIMRAFDDHFRRLSIDLAGNRHVRFFLVAQVDDYLRRVKSTLIARSLLDLPVTIRGDNWEHLDFRGRRAKHDPDSDYSSTRTLLDAATAVIDMAPNTHRGPHDRALRAAGRHTAFLTNRTAFYSDQFQDAGRFTFNFSEDAIRTCVDHALTHPRETVEMGLRQSDRMRELLTEDYYVEQLLAVVDACALACGARPQGTQDFVDFRPLG